MSTKFSIMFAGALGGLSPNIMSLGIALTQSNAVLPESTYFFGLLIFGIMGGAVALIWNETDLRKAFYLGIGLPSIIQLSVDSATSLHETQTSDDQRQALISFFVPEAVAQEQQIMAPDRKLKIIAAEKTPVLEIVFSDATNRREEKILVDQAARNLPLNVPVFACRFAVRIGASSSLYEALPGNRGALTTIRVDVKENSWSGLKQSIGVRATVQYQIDLTKVSEPAR